MKRTLPFLALPAVATLAFGAASTLPLAAVAGGEPTHVTDLQAALGAGSTLEVRDISGSIVVSQASGGTATVHALATAHSGDPASVAIRMVRDGNRLIVCAVYRGGECNANQNRSGGNGNERDDVSVDFTIAIPHGVKLVADTVEGDVVARQLDAGVTARAVSGNITIATADIADAHTVSGSIDATLGKIGRDDDVAFESVSGQIHLTLPAKADATISARTVNGAIAGDRGVPLSVENGQWVGQSGTARLGAGSARISLRTVSGSIRVSQS